MNADEMPRRAPRIGAVAFLLTIAIASAAHADVRDFVGKPLADVRVELAGQPFADPGVLELIETRVGEPLRLEHVRGTVDHLIGLGRFQDVQVFAEPSAERADAVTLRWVLTPVQRVERIALVGGAQLDRAAARGELVDRFGARPSTTRVPEMIEALRRYYADRGYRSLRVEPQTEPTDIPDLVTLVLTLDAGPRTRIGQVSVKSPPSGEPSTASNGKPVSARLQLDAGRPYDSTAIAARIAAYEEELRNQGYYEASVDSSVVFSADNATADMTIQIELGPRVQVVFAGDPLPENRRDTLVPIRQERSIDLDLLEDASRNIENFLRQQGYRTAQAPYTREQRGNDMVLTFTVRRGPLHTLRSAGVVGHDALTDADLAGLVQLQPGEPFVDSRVATVAAAITELYRVRGFARATVKPEIALEAPQMEAGQERRGVTVRFVVTEGAATSVGAITVQGATELPEAMIRAALSMTTGRPFYRPQLDADRDAIERLYRNEGFQDARVAAESSLADGGRQIDVRWVIREGPRTVVDHVLVSGNVKTSSELIRREVALQPGKPLGEDAVTESQRRLAELGLFRRVRIVELPHASSPNRDVVIEVDEAPSTSISEGGGVEVTPLLRRNVEGGQAEARFVVAPRAFFQVSRQNFWGKNRSISLFTRVSFRPRDPAIDSTDPTDDGGFGFNEYRIVGTYREPRPFERPGEMQLTGFTEQAARSSFDFRRTGGRADFARRFAAGVTVSGRYAFDYTQLFDAQILPEDLLPVDRLFPQVRLSTFTGSVLRDSRSDVVDPQSGTVTGFDASVAPRFAGSEVGFSKLFLQGATYRRLPGGSRFIVAAKARFGVAVGFERTVERVDADGEPVLGPDGRPIVDVVDELPASERFFSGGDATVRGFVQDQLGMPDTINDQGFPSGGNGLIVLNLELRAPYWKGVGVVGFFDTGNVFKRASDLSLAELRPTAGFGFRYRSPLGPLRFDFGFNLDPQMLSRGVRERSSLFHFSLGQAF